MPAPLPLPSRTASVSELLDAGSRIWRATLPKCLPLAMIAVVALNVPRFYAGVSGHPITNPLVLPKDPAYWAYYAAAMIVYLFVGSIAILRQRLQTRQSFRAALAAAPARLPALVRRYAQLSRHRPARCWCCRNLHRRVRVSDLVRVLFDTPNLARAAQLVHHCGDTAPAS
jgi:hypothetical protein